MEIERKWLVKKDRIPFDLSRLESHLLEQCYVSLSPTIRARKINGREYVLTVKTHPADLEHPGLERPEFEVPLTAEEYASLASLSRWNVICKTRYLVPLDNGLTGELDIFGGALTGLVYYEIEFPDSESALRYPNPQWVEKDVTYEYRYKNAALAELGMPED